jgi:hypothetical protein
VQRVTPLADSSTRINDFMKALIKAKYPSSVFSHYQLVSVQWPKSPEELNPVKINPQPDGVPEPVSVVNLTMETYMQKKNTGGYAGFGEGAADAGADEGSASCIGCHRISAATPSFCNKGDKSNDRCRREKWYTEYSAIFLRAK